MSSDHQPDSSRDDDEIVEKADHGDEVRNEVDWAERIGRDRAGECLHIPAHPGIAGSNPQRHHVPFEIARPGPERH